jgi:hypothetical protein
MDNYQATSRPVNRDRRRTATPVVTTPGPFPKWGDRLGVRVRRKPQRVPALLCGTYANNFNNGFPFTNSLG